MGKYNITLTGEFDANTLTTAQFNFLKAFAEKSPEVKGDIQKKDVGFEEYWYGLSEDSKKQALKWLESRGKVLVPPCAIGDTVYVVDEYSNPNDHIDEFKVTSLTWEGYQWILFDKDGDDFDENTFNDTVFFTREEAEEEAKNY